MSIFGINYNPSIKTYRLKKILKDAASENPQIYSSLFLCSKELENFKSAQDHKLQKSTPSELKNVGLEIGLSKGQLESKPYR